MRYKPSASSSRSQRTSAAHALARVQRILVAAAVAALVWTSAMSASTVSEYEVKAAVLLKVAKFVEWPQGAFAHERSPLVTCIVGRQSPLRAFESLATNVLGTHPVDVRLVTGDMLDLRQCQIAFFPSDSGADVDYALSKLDGMPVLTVGETEDFARRGGMLALITRDQRVGFAVNVAASKRSGIIVSSQLLGLATLIEERAR